MAHYSIAKTERLENNDGGQQLKTYGNDLKLVPRR